MSTPARLLSPAMCGAFFPRRALLRLRNAAAQTRIVSAARIRLDSGNLCDLCGDISEFESHMPSHAVRAPPANMPQVTEES